jgi:hypothetical protein
MPERETVERAEKTPVKASLHLLKPENSSAKRSITCVRANMVRVRPSKPLPLAFPRPVVLG